MGAARVVAPGAGEIIGDTADRRVEILCETEPLHATWSRFGPGRDGAGHHIHRHHTDCFYVLDGELAIKLADGEAHAAAGSLAVAPRYAVHGFRNAREDAEVRYLNLHAPGCGFVDYMRGLRDATGVDFDQGDPTAEDPAPDEAPSVTTGEPGASGITVLADRPEIAVAVLDVESGTPVERPTFAVYVLDGTVLLDRGGDAVAAQTGAWITVAEPGPTAIAAAGDAPARALVLDVPSASG